MDFTQFKVYTTKPGGALFFPALAAPTDEIAWAPQRGRVCTERGVMMPTRRRTRAQDRAHRITRERAPDEIRLYLERKQEFRAWTTIKPDPPPV